MQQPIKLKYALLHEQQHMPTVGVIGPRLGLGAEKTECREADLWLLDNSTVVMQLKWKGQTFQAILPVTNFRIMQPVELVDIK